MWEVQIVDGEDEDGEGVGRGGEGLVEGRYEGGFAGALDAVEGYEEGR